jgi:hypothetical protein
VTFEFSLQDIQRHTEGVGDLLSVFAFFNRLNLSEELCAVTSKDGVHYSDRISWACACSTEGRWDSLKFQDILVELQSLSLVKNIELGSGYATFTVHPIITEWLFDALQSLEGQYLQDWPLKQWQIFCTRRLQT